MLVPEKFYTYGVFYIAVSEVDVFHVRLSNQKRSGQIKTLHNNEGPSILMNVIISHGLPMWAED